MIPEIPDVDGRDAKELTANVLDSQWQPEREDHRSDEVPEPEVVEGGGNSDKRSRNYASTDVIFVSNGGNTQYEPASVGFRDRDVNDTIDVEIRTGQSRDRLFGEASEEYSGLVGEVKYIVDGLRFGINEWDYVWYEDVLDETEEYGAGTWQATVTVRFEAYSQDIGR